MLNKRYLLKFVLTMVIPVFLFLQSCSLKQTLYIDKNSSGRVSFELTLADYFTDVAEQLSELMPDDSKNTTLKEGFFDLAKIREDFSKDKNVVLEDLSSPSPELLKGELTFDDVSTVFSGNNGGAGIFSFSQTGGIYKLSMEISYTTVESLLSANPSMNSPLMENFGPLANGGLSDEDYLDMMQFVLGDESRAGILDSMLVLDVTVDGVVVSNEGGEKISSSTVKFQIPLLKVLILDQPQVFSVSFKE